MMPLRRVDAKEPASDLQRAADAPVDGAPTAPSGPVLSHDMALAFGPQGLAAVHACLIDTASMSCQSSWSITEKGGAQDAEHDPGFVRAMATIVHLNPPGGSRTVARQLSPQRWAFGWHVDERQGVVVAQAQYRTAHEAPSDIDMALVRMLCDGCIRPADQAVASDARAAEPPAAANDQLLHPDGEAPAAQERRRTGDRRASASRRGWRRWTLLGLCVLAFGGQGLWYWQWRHAEALTSEARRLQALSEATLAQSLAAALDRGDYGELQSELDRFENLRYFDTAVVVNARGQVVSKSNTAHNLRIGQVLEPKSVAGGRSVELRNSAAQRIGRLLVWPHRSAS